MTHEERAERRRQIAECVKQGENPSTVASEFGVTIETVKNACYEYTVQFPKITKNSLSSSLEIIAQLMKGDINQNVLAERFKVSKQRISQIRQEAIKAGIIVDQK